MTFVLFFFCFVPFKKWLNKPDFSLHCFELIDFFIHEINIKGYRLKKINLLHKGPLIVLFYYFLLLLTIHTVVLYMWWKLLFKNQTLILIIMHLICRQFRSRKINSFINCFIFKWRQLFSNIVHNMNAMFFILFFIKFSISVCYVSSFLDEKNGMTVMHI